MSINVDDLEAALLLAKQHGAERILFDGQGNLLEIKMGVQFEPFDPAKLDDPEKDGLSPVDAAATRLAAGRKPRKDEP